ncbi:unnamed protein product [Dibothriocephalus latus]|uniref:Uncharacterized protein n=1 Tax=Dibothriocephalus latus TaxID=60516 RepID=A0A3P6STT1_DIBLA|nr:unnamed protein product [Dibothriocephalus latus]
MRLSMMKDSRRNPKRQNNKTLVPVVASSSELLPGTRIFNSIGNGEYLRSNVDAAYAAVVLTSCLISLLVDRHKDV